MKITNPLTIIAIGIISMLGVEYACQSPVTPKTSQIVLSGSIPQGVYPDIHLTPGATDPTITQAVVTAPGFTTKNYRSVSVALKQAVFKEYNIDWSLHSNYEVDHFKSIEIGGAETISNLWPESLHLNVAGLDEGAKTKDRVEDVLGRLVHTGKLSLVDAQNMIGTDWVAVYLKYVGPLPKYVTK